MYNLKTEDICWISGIKNCLEAAKSHLKDKTIWHNFAQTQNSLRKGFGFSEIQVMIPKNLITERQDRIEVYIRNTLNALIYLSIPKNGNSFKFNWKGNLKLFGYSIRNFNYEIAAMFYNYSVLYFNQALSLSSSRNPEELKSALKFIRLSCWGFKEASKATSKCLENGTPVQELKANELKANFSVSLALGYIILSKVLKDSISKFSNNEKDSFRYTVYLRLKEAYSDLSKIEGNQFKDSKNIKELLLIHQNYHFGEILIEKANHFGQEHKNQLTTGYIGYQIAYLRILNNILASQKKLKININDQDLLQFLDKAHFMIGKLSDLEKENNGIYKAKIPDDKEILSFTETIHSIKPLVQENVNFFDPGIFSIFKGEKSFSYRSAENGLELLLNKSKDIVNSLIEDVERKKQRVYLDHNINGILSILRFDEHSENNKRLREILDSYGGLKGFKDLRRQIETLFQQNNNLAISLKNKIEKDVKEDNFFNKSYGIQIVSLADPGNNIFTSFQTHGVSLTSSSKKDQELIEQLKMNEPFLEKLERERSNMMTTSQIINNNVLGKELYEQDQLLRQNYENVLKRKQLEFNSAYNNDTFVELLSPVLLNKTTLNNLYKEIGDKMEKNTEELKALIGKFYQELDKIVAISIQASNSFDPSMFAEAKKSQDYFSKIHCLHELYSSMLNSVERNTELLEQGKVIEQVLDDFLVSKNIQRDEMKNNQNVYEKTNLNSYSYVSPRQGDGYVPPQIYQGYEQNKYQGTDPQNGTYGDNPYHYLNQGIPQTTYYDNQYGRIDHQNANQPYYNPNYPLACPPPNPNQSEVYNKNNINLPPSIPQGNPYYNQPHNPHNQNPYGNHYQGPY